MHVILVDSITPSHVLQETENLYFHAKFIDIRTGEETDCLPLEFFPNGADLPLDLGNLGNLINNRRMIWTQFKDFVSHMCLWQHLGL